MHDLHLLISFEEKLYPYLYYLYGYDYMPSLHSDYLLKAVIESSLVFDEFKSNIFMRIVGVDILTLDKIL